jgi:putative membrane protein
MESSMITLETFASIAAISLVGIIIFGIAFFLMVKITPFSVVKEIEEDQNTSLAILYGSVFISLAIVISAAVA